ncbi:MAG: hypothetical protein Kow0059_13980 [Candidatus Sumerlaeia bacterium]
MDFSFFNTVLLELPSGENPLIKITPWVLFGLAGNVLFTLRVFVQWIASERARRSVAPPAFWWLSLAATLIMLTYSVGRHEVPFTIGFTLNIAPYLRNIMLCYHVRRRWHVLSFVVSAAALASSFALLWHLKADFIPSRWFYLGLAGNLIFNTRFLLQWLYAEHKGESVLPLWFWYWSIAGAVLCLTYGFILLDIVYILSYLFNIIPMIRNVALHRQCRRAVPAP